MPPTAAMAIPTPTPVLRRRIRVFLPLGGSHPKRRLAARRSAAHAVMSSGGPEGLHPRTTAPERTSHDHATRRGIHGGSAEEPGQTRLDVRHLAEVGGVLRHPRPGEG